MTKTTTPRKRLTMTELARCCNVAQSTVSGILNDRPDCFASKSTRERVLRKARELGYRPNFHAKALVNGRTTTVGIVSTALDVEVTTRTCMAIEHEARQHGYLTFMCFDPNDPAVEDDLINQLHERGVDGVIVFPSEHGNHAALNELSEHGFAAVTIDGAGRKNLAVPDVSVDHEAGGVMQAQHLLTLGRSRVLVANWKDGCHVVEQRISGLERTLKDAGAPPPLRMELKAGSDPRYNWTPRDFDHVSDLLSQHRDDIDCIVGVGDAITLCVAGLAMRQGIRIPEDVAVIGYDGNGEANNTLLPLTTVQNPAEELGRTAFDMLQRSMKNQPDNNQPSQIKIKPKLVTRKSTLG